MNLAKHLSILCQRLVWQASVVSAFIEVKMKCSTCNKKFIAHNEVYEHEVTKEKYVLKTETCSHECERTLHKVIGLPMVVKKV